jgi:hypothetical protein
MLPLMPRAATVLGHPIGRDAADLLEAVLADGDWKAETAWIMTWISPGCRCWLLSATVRGRRWFTARSGTQRARVGAV